MTPLSIIIIIAIYFALLLSVSWISSRGAANSTFFTGDRRMPWGIVAFATLGAAISGVTFISVPGMVVNKGYGYIQMVLGFVAGYAVIGSVLLPLFYRRNLLSIYGYLEERFGRPVYKTGALLFFVSKLLGAAVRFYVVCAVLQILVFEPLGVGFVVNVGVTVALIFLYTINGGVKSLIMTDLIKSACLIGSVVLAIVFIAQSLGMNMSDTVGGIVSHPTSRMFYFDNPMSPNYFWKQFIAGAFMAIAMNGLDQDMMQRHLTCRNWRESRKNMLTGAVVQVFVIALFLVLGTMLVMYAEHTGMSLPEKTDELFGMIATSEAMPVALGVVFIVGLISAAYSAAASALTSLTTSFTIDLLEAHRRDDSEEHLTNTRRRVHLGMAVALCMVILLFHMLSNDDAISAVYTLASYTYGPLLGLFAFGLISGRRPSAAIASAVCLASPLLSLALVKALSVWLGYETGFELLLINAAITIAGLWCASLYPQPLTLPDNGTRPA